MQKILALSIVAVGVLAGCGGGSSSTVAAKHATAATIGPATTTRSGASTPARPLHATSAPSAKLKQAFASFAACLSKNGVKLPAGTSSHSAFSLKGVDTKSATYRRAQSACVAVVNSALKAATSKRPGSTSPSTPSTRPVLPPVKVPASVTAIMTRFTTCMRSHGVPGFPEPKGASFELSGTKIDTHTPAYKSAEASCTSILRALDPPG